MKKLYQILRTAIWCVVGVFFGTSIYQYIDYRQRSDLYAFTLAPRGTRAFRLAPFSRSWSF